VLAINGMDSPGHTCAVAVFLPWPPCLASWDFASLAQRHFKVVEYFNFTQAKELNKSNNSSCFIAEVLRSQQNPKQFDDFQKKISYHKVK